MKSQSTRTEINEAILAIDDDLSKRFIELDPNGYFLIKIDAIAKEIIVEHFSNDLDELGRAVDPETGELLACTGSKQRVPTSVFKARTAKQMGIHLTEGKLPSPITRLDHALYIGRELQKAEFSLIHNLAYIQD